MTDIKISTGTKVAIVTNMPVPYRTPVFERLAKVLGVDNFLVVYCSEKESNRDWVQEQKDFKYTFLKKNTLVWKNRYIHYNLDVIKVLREFGPDVIITTGFYPTSLLAFAYALYHRKSHIPLLDGTIDSEKTLTLVHRIVRKLVFKFSPTFLGASQGSIKLFQSYGISRERIFQSHLCADSSAFQTTHTGARKYDFMFSGRFAPEKNPIFAIDVAADVAKRLQRKVSLLMLGAGPLLDAAKEHAAKLTDHVEVVFPGFVQQDELPGFYGSAKVFLFPSSWDPWGVVANEACSAGQPVIISPHAGAANDLVCHNENGYVLPLEQVEWIEHAAKLLNEPDLWNEFSKNGIIKVQAFNYEAAASGILNSVSALSS